MSYIRTTNPKTESPFLVLRDKREKLRLSLEDIENATKISRRFLAAIEDGEFRLLPGGIFNVSYLRQYAKAVGCDPGELVNAYRTRFEQASDTERKPAGAEAQRAGGFLRLFHF